MTPFAIGVVGLLFLQGSVVKPRMAFVDCLDQASAKAKTDNVAAAQYAEFVKGICATQMETYRSAMIKFDVGNGIKRPQATEDAQMQIDDFLSSAASQYERLRAAR